MAVPEPDPLQRALISLVIRGMTRGAPDDATAALVEQGLAMVKGPITMPTPDGPAAAAACSASNPAARKNWTWTSFSTASCRSTAGSATSAPPGRPGPTARRTTTATPPTTNASATASTRCTRPSGPCCAGWPRSSPGSRLPPPPAGGARPVRDGESAWLASPLMDSYHTVWMQLHQELILMLGLTRADDEAREERLVSGRR